MNMKMPGFTAESALYKSGAVYARVASKSSYGCASMGAAILNSWEEDFAHPRSIEAFGAFWSSCCSLCAKDDTICLSKCIPC